jgi:hypothetical protein
MRMSFTNRQEKRTNAQTWVGSATLLQITPADNYTTAPQIAPLLLPNQTRSFHTSHSFTLFSRTIVC